MAANFLVMTAKAPELTHRFRRYWAVLSDFQRLRRSERDKTPKAAILGYTVIGAITRAFLEDPRATLRALKAGQPSRVAAV